VEWIKGRRTGPRPAVKRIWSKDGPERDECGKRA